MTIRLAVHRICDRCMRPFDESSMKLAEKLAEVGGNLPKIDRKLYRAVSVCECLPGGERGETELFSFQDVCPKCEGVILGYVERIRLESQDEEDRPRRRTRAEKTEVPKTMEVASVSEEKAEMKPESSTNGTGIDVAVVTDSIAVTDSIVRPQSHLF